MIAEDLQRRLTAFALREGMTFATQRKAAWVG